MGNTIKHNKNRLHTVDNKTFTILDPNKVCSFVFVMDNLNMKEINEYTYVKINPKDEKYKGIHYSEFDKNTTPEIIDKLFNIHTYSIIKIDGFVKYIPLDFQHKLVENLSTIINCEYIKIGFNYYQRLLKTKHIIITTKMCETIQKNTFFFADFFKSNITLSQLKQDKLNLCVDKNNVKFCISDLNMMSTTIIMYDELNVGDKIFIKCEPIITYLKHNDKFIVSYNVLEIRPIKK